MSTDETLGDDCLPRRNSFLLGHEYAEKMLLDAWKNNSLHNSWLITGIEGIGKATLAYRFARFLLYADENKKESYTTLNVPEDSQAFRLVANDAHPDLKVLERDYTETDRKKVMKAIKDGEAMSDEELKGLKKSAFIRVDDVRTINEFLSKKSSNDGWRVVIIDSVDDMNAASANAVLKILEEPPAKALMLLVSHNPNRLLPTIRSRCAKLNMQPLDENNVASLLRRYRPDTEEKAVKELAHLSSGSIGKALTFLDKGAMDIYARMLDILKSGKNFKLADMIEFCNSTVKDEDCFYLVQELLLKYLAENIRTCHNMEAMLEMWEKANHSFDEADRLNLDKKQVMLNVLYSICKVV